MTAERERVRSIPIDGGEIEALTLPGGPGTPLIVLGGVETALRRLAGTETILVHRWRSRRAARTVIVLGRPIAASASDIERLAHPRHVARAVAAGVDTFGRSVAVEAESGGGRIALWLAVERPGLVERMVLASVAAQTPPAMAGALGEWIALAEQHRWGELFRNIAAALRPAQSGDAASQRVVPERVAPPPTPERFIAELRATLDPSSFVTDRLATIAAPALVLAGGRDAVVPVAATREVADRMPAARFELDPECGHTVRTSFCGYDELVEAFLSEP